jgi:hypothetical protein
MVNGVDYSDIVAYEGYEVSEEDLHADGSGRNPLDGLMEFTIVAEKRHANVTFTNCIDPARVAALISAVKANNRVNQYTIYNPNTNSVETFTGYINKRSIGVFNRGVYRMNLKQFTLNIIEM